MGQTERDGRTGGTGRDGRDGGMGRDGRDRTEWDGTGRNGMGVILLPDFSANNNLGTVGQKP